MPKYIERDSLLKKAKSLQNKLFAVPLILDAIEYAPTVDVVEVVRCKDCEHWKPREAKYGYICHMHAISTYEDDFCSFGETKEGAEE
jgi:hypothetical protein